MNLGKSPKTLDFSPKGDQRMSDVQAAYSLMEGVIGARGTRESKKSMLERAYGELRRQSSEWTRRRVRAIFDGEARRIDYREIVEMQAVLEARDRHAAYREETARIAEMARRQTADCDC